MGKSLSRADTDAQAILKEIMPSIQEALEQEQTITPVAAVLAPDGSVRRLPSAPTPASLPTQEAVAVCREQLRAEIATGQVRMAAHAADVRIWRRRDGDQASNAISVHVEDTQGYCVDLLIPYKIRQGMMSRLRRKKMVLFRQMIAQQSEPMLFTTPLTPKQHPAQRQAEMS